MDYIEDQKEEIETIKAIFPEELSELSLDPPCFMVRLNDLDIPLPSPLFIKLTLPPEYPQVVPEIEIPNRSKSLPQRVVEDLLRFLQGVAENSLGMVMVFTIINAAKEWINDNTDKIHQEQKLCEEGNATINLSASIKTAEEEHSLVQPQGGTHGGLWKFVIGLIGKPSAGKSTFFNAATHEHIARVGAHPFTTIDPNIGQGYYAIECPCTMLQLKRCDAVYGHTGDGRRYVPVLLKDVAGLVPGACEGRGKGNRFLNDLLDADVLIHVIDASGETDENGRATSGYDPLKDVTWVHEELHRWIYDNIMSKWDTILKRPKKFPNMFTGYHCTPHLIKAVFQSVGLTDQRLENLKQIPDAESQGLVHKLVDTFLQMRFPILLALNKADLPNAKTNIEQFQRKFKNSTVVPVSAKCECYLQEKAKKEIISYSKGRSDYSVNSERTLEDCCAEELSNIDKNVLKPYGNTGVLEALCQAVQLRSPLHIFPVKCLDTYQSISVDQKKELQVLRDCIVIKPGTTVGKLFEIMVYPPVCLLGGEYVRTECVNQLTGKKQVLHKDDVVVDSNSVIKVLSTKKATQSTKLRN